MESIHIKNFGGIKEMTMEINKINILIGPQASGKSVTAKLIYFFKKIPILLLSELESPDDKESLEDLTLDQFLRYFPRDTWPKGNFHIEFKSGGGKIQLQKVSNRKNPLIKFNSFLSNLFKTLKMEFRDISQISGGFGTKGFRERIKRREVFFKSIQESIAFNEGLDQFFIPAGRNFYAQAQSNFFTLLNSNQNLDPFLVEFGSMYENLKEIGVEKEELEYHFELLTNEILHGALVRKEKKDWIYHTDGRIVNLSKASSGQQEAVPLLYLIAYFPLLRFNNDGARIFIEEPEAHLFPTAQRKIVQLLSRLANESISYFELFITTHSPYILSSFNNLMEAGKIAKEQPDKKNEIEKVVPKEEWLNPDDVNAYSITAGKLESLIDKETKLISQNHLDSVSDDLAIDFGKLLDIEY
jgi:AAA15 family ATPase/GTPase